ncbi:MAG: hypothetical protein J2P24_00675 [Streptosporangiales bacterium]|nr:hypothetical protein [Streptosporangiales bacterium]MBO0889831.1 hypothetical protein [Acidothermales bacterium]
MSQCSSRLARLRRRLARAYHLACAREDALLRGLRVPTGVWLCEHCRLVLWDHRAFVGHVRGCSA